MKAFPSKRLHSPSTRMHPLSQKRFVNTLLKNAPVDLILVKSPKGVSIMEIYASLAHEAITVTVIVVISQLASSDARIFLLIVAVDFFLLHTFVMVARSATAAGWNVIYMTPNTRKRYMSKLLAPVAKASQYPTKNLSV